MKHVGHPIWGILNIAVVLAFVLLFSWINATNFDQTEARVIILTVLGFAGWEGAKRVMRGKEESE